MPTPTAEQISDALATAVDVAARSTVLVSGRRRFPASGVAWSDDGLVVTANHVVERDDEIGILLPDGTETAASVLGRDPRSDLAVLKIDSGVTAAADRDFPQDIKVGQLALAVARPGPGAPQASFGVISGFVAHRRRASAGRSLIRPDLTMYPGFSGGPLVDTSGRVIGINSSHLGRGGGLTIPTANVDRIVTALSTDGRVRRAYFGVATQPARLADEVEGSDAVLLVVMVDPGSPAAVAGLMVGDSLVSVDGERLRSADDLQFALGQVEVGAEVKINAVRGGVEIALTVTAGERPQGG